MLDQNPDTNTLIWDALAPVDRAFTKPIVGKSYKGDSPNPTYIIKKLTGAFGPIGGKWGFNVKFDRTRHGLPHQVITRQHVVMSPDKDEDGNRATLEKTVEYDLIREEHHEVCITFWFRGEDCQTGTFDAFGGTPMLYMAKSGKWMHDEDAAKKSLTDAYTKGASWLGACADIFLGLFDDKYTSQPEGGNAPQGDAPKPDKTTTQTGNRTSTAPDNDGWG
jgi:hypothetical protein